MIKKLLLKIDDTIYSKFKIVCFENRINVKRLLTYMIEEAIFNHENNKRK